MFAHQTLEQLVLKDDDRELLHAVLAIPNRVCFGSLFFDEAQILARQMYLAKINPEEIKHVVETITYKPVPTQVLLESWTTGGSKTEGGSEADGEGTATARGVTYDQDGNPVGTSATSTGSLQRSSSRSFSSASNWSHATTQAWTTFYQEVKQLGGVTFRTIDEQIFNFAKQLVLQPIGQGAVARLREAPRACRLPELKDIEQTDEQIGAFLDAVYTGRSGSLYLDTAAVDHLLAEREWKLLMETGPRIVDSYAPRSLKSKRRKGAKAMDEDQP